MKRLGKIVSIVPVIAKADTLTMEERLEFKQRVSPAQQHSTAQHPSAGGAKTALQSDLHIKDFRAENSLETLLHMLVFAIKVKGGGRYHVGSSKLF